MRREFTLAGSNRPGASATPQHSLSASNAPAFTLALTLAVVVTTPPINAIYKRIVLPLEQAGATPTISILSPGSVSHFETPAQHVHVAAGPGANTDSAYQATAMSNHQAELWTLLNEWNAIDPGEADKNYAERKVDLDRNSVSFDLS